MNRSNNSDAATLLGLDKPSSKNQENPSVLSLDQDPNFNSISIYRVYFDMVIHLEEAGEDITISESFDVASGRDAREAQTKVENHVLHSGKFSLTPKAVYITGVKKLATTEI